MLQSAVHVLFSVNCSILQNSLSVFFENLNLKIRKVKDSRLFGTIRILLVDVLSLHVACCVILLALVSSDSFTRGTTRWKYSMKIRF